MYIYTYIYTYTYTYIYIYTYWKVTGAGPEIHFIKRKFYRVKSFSRSTK